jgi:outer membrane murein-binding lipoprotein Lpp
MTHTSKVLAVVSAGLLLAGCAEPPFDANVAAMQVASQEVELDQEQVLLTMEQVQCGEREELWTVFDLGAGRSVARMTKRGTGLGFTDDIHIGDPGIGAPYGQVRGKFALQPANPRLREIDEKTKMLEAKTRVVMKHPCLETPPPVLMGLRHGQFSPSETPNFRFRLRGGDWVFDQLVH